MKKFKFKLEAVLRLRRHQKDLVVQELAEVLAVYNAIQAQLNLLQAEIEKARTSYLPLHLSAQRDLFIQSVQVKRHRLQAEQRAQEILLSEKRREVAKAQSDLRAVEKLRDKQKEAWQKDFQRQEDRELAEIASRKAGYQL